MQEERKKAIEQGYEYAHVGIQALNKTSVMGFAYRPRGNPVRVSVRINGQPVKKNAIATLHRPNLHALRPPRNCCVGFDIQLPKPLESGDTVTCFVPATGQILEERMFA